MTQKSIKKSKSPKRSRGPGEARVDDYQVVLQWSEADQCYLATLPAWQNATTHGDSLEDAVRNSREVLQMLIETALKNGEPLPAVQRSFSGNLRVRLSRTLHARLASEAEREGVSLNQLIVTKLAS
jgi:antitoxin HicB